MSSLQYPVRIELVTRPEDYPSPYVKKLGRVAFATQDCSIR